MGFFDDIFGDKKKAGGGGGGDNNNRKNNNNNNPLANMRRNIEQTIGGVGKPKMSGPGRSLGGSKPGTVYVVTLERPGPVGIRVEKRSNTSASAIVNTVVEGSQAEAAGLQRGDVLCFAGSNGQDEIPYDMFLEIVRSPQRPIHLEARRLDQSSAAATKSTGSADAEARRRAMIAAAERREKKHKSQTKTIKHVTKSTLLKQQQHESTTAAASGPQTEESRMAAAAAKRDEANLAAELGYNPYEAIKKTAGQARSATTATQHGAITAPGGGVGGGSGGNITPTVPLPAVAPPSDLDAHAAAGGYDDDDPRFHDFEVALATVASSSDPTSAKNGLKIARKLVANATTKGQQLSSDDADKFRRVRLANPKIRAAIAEVPGNLDLMLAVGFQLATDDAAPDDNDNDESLLVFPAGTKGPAWLPRALAAMEAAETSIVVGS